MSDFVWLRSGRHRSHAGAQDDTFAYHQCGAIKAYNEKWGGIAYHVPVSIVFDDGFNWVERGAMLPEDERAWRMDGAGACLAIVFCPWCGSRLRVPIRASSAVSRTRSRSDP